MGTHKPMDEPRHDAPHNNKADASEEAPASLDAKSTHTACLADVVQYG